MSKILVVEDDRILADTIKDVLIREKYDVDLAFDGIEGSEKITGEYDLILLDVMLPYKDGFTVLKEAREARVNTPIIMLTAKSELEDKLNGLDGGADDYITKPFVVKELLARIRANTRRNQINKKTYKNLSIDEDQCVIENNKTNESVKLGAKEFMLLSYLLENQNQILSKEQIILKIWGYDDESEYNNVEVYISFIRKKLAFIHSEAEIKTVRSMGYVLK